MNIVFLDYCRNTLSQGPESGLAPMKATGTFIGFATYSGKTAQTTRKGSYYTAALAENLATPGLSITDMHTQVTARVKQLDPSQNPEQHSGLDKLFYFKSGPAAGSKVTSAIQAAASARGLRRS